MTSELTNSDIAELTAFRHALHRQPEVSNEEIGAARAVVDFLTPTEPDEVLTGLGGNGVAAVYGGMGEGPTILFRAELDALPIEELAQMPHRSQVPGKGHMCGHDGHMAILAAVGRALSRRRPARGRLVLMFQPAEETGNGAADVTADPRYASIRPDYAFSLHNMPGTPLGHVRIAEGVVNCASRGMRVVLEGKTAHASMPETGVSPMQAMAGLMPALAGLGGAAFDSDDFAMATVSHAVLGEPTFGVAPGRAQINVTLRTRADARMAGLCGEAEAIVHAEADRHGLKAQIDYHEIFVASVNAPEAVAELTQTFDALSIPYGDDDLPMRGSEDFGVFGHGSRSAMLFLGAGERHAALHNPDYDFPDDLIPIGARIFLHTARRMLG